MEHLRVAAVARHFLVRRPFIVGPLALAALSALFASEAPQRWVATVGFLMGVTLFTAEAVLARRRRVGPAWLFGSLALTLVAVAGMTWVLGGLSGPFVPMLFAPATVAFAAFGVGRRAAVLLAGLLMVLAVLAFVPAPFPPLEVVTHRFIALAAALAGATLLFLGVAGLSTAWAAAAGQALQASEAVVAQARARVRSIEELTGHFAHELKNPLAAVRGIVELSRERAGADEKLSTGLSLALEEVGRLEQRLARGLDFAKPATPALRSWGEVWTLASDTLEVLRAYAERRGVQLELTGTPLQAAVDGPRIKEALINLLLNAIEAAPTQTTVTLEVRGEDADVCLTVSDRGPRLPDELLAKLGTPFFTTRAGGTGLGVAMATTVAVQHDGALRYVSDDMGTRAVLRFPKEGTT